ncbi:MAG: electron transport complex subunit E [bacterium]|nr:electron transport complex subunit E [bacterium]
MSNSPVQEFTKGIWKENPVLIQLLGMCPVLAVTGTVVNGLAMGLATSFVLICSNIIISLLRNFIPKQVRIACYIVVIATFVTMADIFIKANFMDISKALGPFIPLIVVNCLILGRAEAFASKHSCFKSILDGLGMGAGFTLGLILISSVRELLGNGSILGMSIIGSWFKPWLIMVLPPGAFIAMGFIVAGMHVIKEK